MSAQFTGGSVDQLVGFENRTIQWITTGANLDSCTDPTKVYAWGAVAITNSPETYCRMFYYPGDAPVQIIIKNDGSKVWRRINTGSWSSWASTDNKLTGVSVNTGDSHYTAYRTGNILCLRGDDLNVSVNAHSYKAFWVVPEALRPAFSGFGIGNNGSNDETVGREICYVFYNPSNISLYIASPVAMTMTNFSIWFIMP